MKKRFLVAVLSLVLALAMTTTVFAETPKMDGEVTKAPVPSAVKTAYQKSATFAKKELTWTKHNSRVYAGKDYGVVVNSANNSTYLYYIPSKAGYMHVYGFKGYVTLYNANKKAISKKIWVNYDSGTNYFQYASFAVKKNTKYYLRFQSTGEYLSDYDMYAFGLHISKYSVSENSGATKSKSKTIKYNTTRKGTVLSGVNYKADYYKFYSNKSSFKLTLDGFTSGTLYATVTHKYAGKTYTRKMTLTRGKSYYVTASGLGKGTWYIKVYRASSLDNGYYTLKWK